MVIFVQLIITSMRHKNSISQINLERDKEIRALYKKARELAGYHATVERICQIMVNLPTSKFYISDTYALKYVKDRMNGNVRKLKWKNKQILYNAFWNVFLSLKKKRENEGLSIERLVDMALETQAPIIGVSQGFIMNIILRNRLNIRQYSKRVKEEP